MRRPRRRAVSRPRPRWRPGACADSVSGAFRGAEVLAVTRDGDVVVDLDPRWQRRLSHSESFRTLSARAVRPCRLPWR